MQQKISFHNSKAVIFDMDGTMVNNAAYHKKAWQRFLAKHNLSLTDEEFKEKISGKKNHHILPVIFGELITAAEISQYAEEKEAAYREVYAQDIREVPGLSSIIAKLKSHTIKLAIATTAPEKNRTFVLNSLHLNGQFEVILGDEHVTHGKPNPEIYLGTAKKLNVRPHECIVFEDSPSGVAAGKNAGMTVIGILTSHSTEDLNQADFLVNDFTEVKFHV